MARSRCSASTRSSRAVGSVASTSSACACSASAAVGPDWFSADGMKSTSSWYGLPVMAGSGEYSSRNRLSLVASSPGPGRCTWMNAGSTGGSAGRPAAAASARAASSQPSSTACRSSRYSSAAGRAPSRKSVSSRIASQVGAGPPGEPGQVVAPVGGVRPDAGGLRQRAVVDERRQQRLLEVDEQPAQQVRVAAGAGVRAEPVEQRAYRARQAELVHRGQHGRAEPAEVLPVEQVLDALRVPLVVLGRRRVQREQVQQLLVRVVGAVAEVWHLRGDGLPSRCRPRSAPG